MKLSYQHTVWACNFGFISQAVVNNLAPLLFVVFKEQFGLTDEQLGRLILMNFGTQIVADILATRYVDRIGQRICAVAAHLFCACGLILMGVLPFALPSPYVGLCVAAVLYAMGGGIIEVMVSPIVEALPGEHKEKAMSMVHSFYCWGQAAVVLISTLLLWRFSQGMWRLLPIGWALIPLAKSVAFARVPLMPATPESERTKIGTLLKSKAFFIAILMMVASGSAELSMSQWSSLFAEQALGVNKVLGDLLGPCAFALCMAFTRMMYGLHGEKVAVDRALVLFDGGSVHHPIPGAHRLRAVRRFRGVDVAGHGFRHGAALSLGRHGHVWPAGHFRRYWLLGRSVAHGRGERLRAILHLGRFSDGAAFPLRGTTRPEGRTAGGSGFPGAAVGVRLNTRAAKSRLTRQKVSFPAQAASLQRIPLYTALGDGTKARSRAYHGSGKLWRPPRAWVWPRQVGCACGIPRGNVNCANCWAFC